MADTFGPTVSADWLAAHLDDPDVAVVDVRWSLDDGPKRAARSGSVTAARAYPFEVLQKNPTINDVFDDEAVLLLYDQNGAGGTAFSRSVDGSILTFSDNDGDKLVDNETHSVWTRKGVCIEGKHRKITKGAAELALMFSAKRFCSIFDNRNFSGSCNFLCRNFITELFHRFR